MEEDFYDEMINEYKDKFRIERIKILQEYAEKMKNQQSMYVYDKSKENYLVSSCEKNKSNEKKSMSFLIKLTGNEKETCRGLYLPIHDDIEVYIPKELYKKNGNKIEIINNNSSKAVMSEYKMNPNERTKDKWLSQLTLQDFYKKYLGRFEIQMEREVMA